MGRFSLYYSERPYLSVVRPFKQADNSRYYPFSLYYSERPYLSVVRPLKQSDNPRSYPTPILVHKLLINWSFQSLNLFSGCFIMAEGY